LLVKKN